MPSPLEQLLLSGIRSLGAGIVNTGKGITTVKPSLITPRGEGMRTLNSLADQSAQDTLAASGKVADQNRLITRALDQLRTNARWKLGGEGMLVPNANRPGTDAAALFYHPEEADMNGLAYLSYLGSRQPGLGKKLIGEMQERVDGAPIALQALRQTGANDAYERLGFRYADPAKRIFGDQEDPVDLPTMILDRPLRKADGGSVGAHMEEWAPSRDNSRDVDAGLAGGTLGGLAALVGGVPGALAKLGRAAAAGWAPMLAVEPGEAQAGWLSKLAKLKGGAQTELSHYLPGEGADYTALHRELLGIPENASRTYMDGARYAAEKQEPGSGLVVARDPTTRKVQGVASYTEHPSTTKIDMLGAYPQNQGVGRAIFDYIYQNGNHDVPVTLRSEAHNLPVYRKWGLLDAEPEQQGNQYRTLMKKAAGGLVQYQEACPCA